jgi:hypothetical protein
MPRGAYFLWFSTANYDVFEIPLVPSAEDGLAGNIMQAHLKDVISETTQMNSCHEVVKAIAHKDSQIYDASYTTWEYGYCSA